MNGQSVSASLPAAVRAALDSRRVTANDLVAAVDVDPGDVVLLTGSVARGEARAHSDIDLLVVTGRQRHRASTATLVFPSILGESLVADQHGVQLNVEYAMLEQVQQLARVMRPAVDGVARLPNLQTLELRLIQGLHTGVVLQGHAELPALRELLDPERVRAAATALALLGTLTLLQGSTSLSEPAATMLRRTAAESLLTAGVCAYAALTYDVKHLVRRAAALADRTGLPSLFARYEELLFADRLPGPQADDLILDLAVELYDAMPEPARAFLAPFRQEWAWSGRVFR